MMMMWAAVTCGPSDGHCVGVRSFCPRDPRRTHRPSWTSRGRPPGMPRSVTRPKKSPHRVKQKATKPKHQKVARPNVFDHSVLDYDPSETQFSNYKQLGLLADANTIGAARSTITGFKPRNLGQPCADPTPEGGVHPLKNEVCEKRYVHRTLKPVDTAAAPASSSAPRPPLPQPWARAP